MKLLPLSSFSFLILLLSCSGAPIERHYDGSVIHDDRGMPAEFNQPIKKKLTVLDFFNESPYGGKDLGVVATEELKMELYRTGEFLMENPGEGLLGSSKKIYVGGGMSLVQLGKKARLMGINFIAFGRVVDARVRDRNDEIGVIRKRRSFTQSKVELKVYDVHSNKVIYSDVLDGIVKDSSYNFYLTDQEEVLSYRQELLRYGVKVAIRKSIPQILEMSAKYSWTGRVAKIIGRKIYVNAGRESGIQVGDVLKVLTEGEEIYDPESGALVGKAKGDVKGTLEVVDYFGNDGAVAIIHSGGYVNEGDFVKLY